MWEYITITFSEPSMPETLCEILNDIGKEGWQLASANPHPISATDMIMVYIFQRPIVEKSAWLARRAQQLELQKSLQSKVDAKRSVRRPAPDPNNFNNS